MTWKEEKFDRHETLDRRSSVAQPKKPLLSSSLVSYHVENVSIHWHVDFVVSVRGEPLFGVKLWRASVAELGCQGRHCWKRSVGLLYSKVFAIGVASETAGRKD